jgi:hypothetical protein
VEPFKTGTFSLSSLEVLSHSSPTFSSLSVSLYLSLIFKGFGLSSEVGVAVKGTNTSK